MISLLLALVLTNPPPMQRCVTACFDRGALTECVDTREVRCVPRVVNLGTWSPVLLTYSPAPYTGP